MSKNRIYFAVLSVIFLLVMALSPLKDFFSEWKGYQHQYNDIIQNQPEKIKPTEVGIKQVWVKKLDKVDRCITCHLGLKEKALTDVKQPFTTHPRIYHDFEDFGCTICHEGQGPATTFKESIGKVKFWERPILPREYMEASCGKCHKEENVPGAPILTLGRRLIKEYNCSGCHKINGFKKQWVPSLDGIGSKVNKTWLFNWLKDPKKYFSKTKMPNFQLTDEEANILADFLLTFKSFPSKSELEPIPKLLTEALEKEEDKMIEHGTTRFREARCISCHSINGKGGYAANDLGKIASKVNTEWLYNYVKSPRILQPEVIMPRYRFSDQDLSAVVNYMVNEFVDEEMEEITFNSTDPDYNKKGLALYEKYNCGGCHELNIKQTGEIAPELTFIGSKKLYEIDFGNTDIEQTLPSYIYTKVSFPRTFSPKMRMPSYTFSKVEAQAITAALLGNVNDNIPEELKIYPEQPSDYLPQGEFGKLVNDLACLGCHTMFGQGKLVATDLSLIASKTQRNWLKSYFKVPYSLRPILTERMPNLFMSDEEIMVIVDYMEKVFIADSIYRDITMDEGRIEKGKILYFEKYGCQSCHQIESKGGFVGPALDKAALRLKSGWVFRWLKNPQSLEPETIEPNNNLTDEEADAITAFIMSLK